MQYKHVKSLRCATETNIMLHVSYITIKKRGKGILGAEMHVQKLGEGQIMASMRGCKKAVQLE